MSSSHHHLHHLPGAALPAVRCCVLHTLIHSLRSMFCVEHEIGQPQRQILFVVTPFDKFRPERRENFIGRAAEFGGAAPAYMEIAGC
jgi:hypothetical protein